MSKSRYPSTFLWAIELSKSTNVVFFLWDMRLFLIRFLRYERASKQLPLDLVVYGDVMAQKSLENG